MITILGILIGARKNNEINVRRLQKDLEGAKNELENYRKKVSAK